DAISVSGRVDVDGEDTKKPVATGLSQAFDSAAATMRLAALTCSSEEVDELSKTMKMARPTGQAIKQAAANVERPAVSSAPRAAARPNPSPAAPGGGNLLLIIIVVSVLLALAGMLLL
ncbi:MAG: serine/threonine protein kinase, partial [Nitrosomonadales bacterium]|nr:serine/threonine protein kinase [Nitrosomonadales bacterium]